MLNKESYEVLKNFPEKLHVKDKRPIHHELFNAGYLRVDPDESLKRNYYHITQKGKTAVEEYERSARGERRDDEALVRSTWANIISALALAVSIAALIVSVAVR